MILILTAQSSHLGALRTPGLGPTPPRSIRISERRTHVDGFSKAHQMFPGCSRGWGLLLSVSWDELNLVKPYCSFACLIIKVMPVVEKKKPKGPESAKRITFSSWCVPSGFLKNTCTKKKYQVLSQNKVIPHLSKEKIKKSFGAPLKSLGIQMA